MAIKRSGIRHWELLAHWDSEPATYSWRCIGNDGRVVRESGRFASFGKAMVNAMDNGFNTGRHRWIKTGARYTIHFAPGMAPALVPAASPHPAKPPRRIRHAGGETTE